MTKVLKFFWVDDMENWASSTQTNLQIIAKKYDLELKIIWARNGESIVQKLVYDFDAVIMDYHMEPFNGDIYIKEIRFEEHLEHIPILFYSEDVYTDLGKLVENIKNVTTIHRRNLEDKIKEMFF